MSSFAPVSYKFICSALLTAGKSLVYTRLNPTPTGAAEEGRFYRTDLWIGTTEEPSDLYIPEAVCTVERNRVVKTTALVGLEGCVKEQISFNDYALTLEVGLVAVRGGVEVDEYPAEGIKALRSLLDKPQALYVRSPFLQLFDITRIVPTKYTVKQDSHSNRQAVSITAVSDRDYTIEYNEY